MKHKNAEFIKAWADDAKSVQQRWLGHPNNPWQTVDSLIEFNQFSYREFRHTPKPEHRYFVLWDGGGCPETLKTGCNVKATFIDGKITAVELITESAE